MKRKIALFAVLAVVAMAFVSCGGKEEKTKEIITKKIMYDVPVVNENLKTPEDFERDWLNYIFSFEDLEVEKEEYSFTDRDLEIFYIGGDISIKISNFDKSRLKRYRKER